MTTSPPSETSADAADPRQAPARFAITRPVDAAALYGTNELTSIASDYTERFWLPTLGPSAYCVLRIFERDMLHATHIFEPIVYTLDDVADALNLPKPRVRHTLRRLQVFRLLHEERDPLELPELADVPVYVVDRMIPRLRPKLWHRLPASVRDQQPG